MEPPVHDFELFYSHFLRSHTRASTRWAHVAAIGIGATGVWYAAKTRSLKPLVLGVGAGVALALAAHPLFEGNRAENTGHPMLAARALARMCFRTITGAVKQDLVLALTASEG